LAKKLSSHSSPISSPILIVHRLSTIRDADQVLVINHGEIIERGSHESLLEQQGFYHHLYMSQFKGQEI
jgi:ATP-binding cassette subfamily B protein